MKILIDTNIIIDNLTRRDEYAESLKILKHCENGKIDGIMTTVTVMDVMYITRKYLSYPDSKNAVLMLMQIIDVVPALKTDIYTAFNIAFNDFEDAVQSAVAERVGADYIVTRNVKDYKNSFVPAISPADFLRVLIEQ